jgi:hypothetical protein
MDQTQQYILGEHDEILSLESMQDNRDIALSMIQQAKRSLHIFTQDLDPPLFDTPAFTEAVKNVAIHDSHSYVQIIVKDTKYAVLHGHRLIELARRLSSHIHIRKAGIEYKEYSAAYLIADETGYLRRNNAYRYEGIACFNARNDCRHLLDFFNTAWEKSAPDPELRRLHI